METEGKFDPNMLFPLEHFLPALKMIQEATDSEIAVNELVATMQSNLEGVTRDQIANLMLSYLMDRDYYDGYIEYSEMLEEI
jgi:hypothetical protein